MSRHSRLELTRGNRRCRFGQNATYSALGWIAEGIQSRVQAPSRRVFLGATRKPMFGPGLKPDRKEPNQSGSARTVAKRSF